MTDRTPDERLGDDELVGGLNAAFDAEPHSESVLKALDARPLHLPGSEPVPAGDATGRYQVVGEIARGGMGVIYKGRDVDLGRDVAMKVLRTSYKDNTQATERFMEEAQIGGQLQHPGIVPVYELGLDAEEQPYFSMKLVKGKTLAALLKEGETSRRRLLTIFEQVCQTMAYAHARGVVHRDLKPANVMVGAFGEVQVVDWGFAKVLGQGGIADERPRPDVSIIATVRSSGEGSDSIAGSVMGTPAYMPPEQALGQVEALDERSDVFGLGAILYELLTGTTIYAKDGGDNLLVQAARCDLAPAFARLADEELEPLLRECLAANQSDRPKDATYVAGTISEHLADVDDRAHEAELAEAEAAVHAEGEHRKRRLTLVLGAALVLAVALGGVTWWWLDARHQERVAETAQKSRGFHDEAVARLGAGEHAAALEAVRSSIHLLETEGLEAQDARELETKIEKEAGALQTEQAQRRKDDTLREALLRLRSALGEDRDAGALHEGFERAFEAHATGDATLAERLEGLPVEAASALTEWAVICRDELDHGQGEWRALFQRAGRIDLDPDRTELREAYREREVKELKRVAAEAELESLGPATIDLLALLLDASDARDEAIQVLEKGQFLFPGDYFLNLRLGALHPNRRIALRHLTAATALHPEVEEAQWLLDRRLGR